jgi:ABC-type spermidine/putrescine transport system permease subunit II
VLRQKAEKATIALNIAFSSLIVPVAALKSAMVPTFVALSVSRKTKPSAPLSRERAGAAAAVEDVVAGVAIQFVTLALLIDDCRDPSTATLR